MKLELYEVRGNLDKVNASLLATNSNLDKMVDVSPESEVYVDKLRAEPGTHTWAHVTDKILMDDDIAYVVLRSNKRQLIAISHDSEIVGESDRYLMVWSDYAFSLPEVQQITNERQTVMTSSNVNVQRKMWKTVEAAIENLKGKKNWDILVVKKDKNLRKKKEDREEARKGMEIKPVRPGKNINNDKLRIQRDTYNMYMNSLKTSLGIRLKNFIKSKLANIESKEDLINVLKSNTESLAPSKIKIANIIYEFNDYSLRKDNKAPVVTFIYRSRDNVSIPSSISSFAYEVILRGFNSNNTEIDKMYFRTDYGSSRTPFEEGIEKLKELK